MSDGQESRYATFRQILQQKWSNMEHYDRMDQNLLVSVFALSGGAFGLKEKVGADALQVIYWLAVLLCAAAIAAVFRSFVEYQRNLGVICRMEQALGVFEAVGERPSLPSPSDGYFPVKIAAKLLRTWRAALLLIYGAIGAFAFSSATGGSLGATACIAFLYVLLAYLWFVLAPLRRVT